MLYLYQSNRLEDLAELLQAVRQRQPLNHPLAAEELVVQSQGMRRFLNQYLANSSGIAANLHFSLPAALAWRLMREILPDTPALSPFSTEVMRWRLLDLFGSERLQTDEQLADSRQALAAYLGNGEQAAYQLSGQLADIFDQYLVYRPDWINSWQSGKLLGLGEGERWQAELWRFLDDGAPNTPHRVALWQNLLAGLGRHPLPERILVFGIATLAPMYLQLLQALGEHIDIHIFALNPSSEFWGNALSPAHLLEHPEAEASGHPLLASLGKQGRDFFDALTESGARLELQVYADEPPSNSLLHNLQHDIQTLTQPGSNGTAEWDDSIHIVSAHSPLRELQILKEQLLDTLQQHPDWQPHDIAVLTPNIEPYAPFIEAVFGQRQGNAQALPYSLSDVKLSRNQPLLHALEQSLAVLDSRFEVDRLLALLESPNLLQRFGLQREDLPLLHETVAQLHIRWGSDAEMRGEADNLFTWQQGLDRLILGWLLPENSGLWQHTSAFYTDPNQLEILARFAAFVRTLADIRRNWDTPAGITLWAQRLRELTDTLFDVASSDQNARQQIDQLLARWQEEADLAGFSRPLPRETAVGHIRRFLDSHSEAGFLRGGITICSMVPMRSLPFKMICLLGLNDNDFPRNTRAPAFDLIARHPRKGDRARREDDRYLFLETLMSAREKLYLSYIGRDIRKDEELAPSALLGELFDTLAAMTNIPARQLREQYIKQHPLQAFSHQYFNGQSFSSSRSDYADALNQPPSEPQPFYRQPLNDSADNPTEISQHSFLQFWRNPASVWLRQNLGWKRPYTDPAWDAAEPFEPVDEARIGSEYLAARQHNEDFNRTAERLQAESSLPAGELGRLWRQHYEQQAKSLNDELIKSPKLPATPYSLPLGDYRLIGCFNRHHQHGQLYFLDRKSNAPTQIALYLEHLIFNAVRPTGGNRFESHWLYEGQCQTLPEVEQNAAQALLQQWLADYLLGQTHPLPFFPRVCLKAAEAYLKDNKAASDEERWQKAYQAALSAYNGGYQTTGQRDYPEVALLFGRNENSPLDSPLFRRLIEELLLPTVQLCQVKVDQENAES